jgi:hypothetical protein
MRLPCGWAGLRVPRASWQPVAAGEARPAGGPGRMTPEHHRVRDFAVTGIARTGEALSPAQIAAGTGLGGDRAAGITGELERGKTVLCRRTESTWTGPARLPRR